MERIDMVGQRVGRLEVVAFAGSRNKRRFYVCVCECGTQNEVTTGDLRSGKIKSCGCYKNELVSIRNKASATHRMTHTPTYTSWYDMKQRCRYKKDISYKNYGGRGISYCKEWESFENFLKDMGVKPLGKSIDRINNDGNYEPGNCRWATHAEQQLNKRKKNGN